MRQPVLPLTAIVLVLAAPAASRAELGLPPDLASPKAEEAEEEEEGTDEDLFDDDGFYAVDEVDDDDPPDRDLEDEEEEEWLEDEGAGGEGGSGRGRLSPSWFFASLGLTLVAGAGAIVTGALTLRLNELYFDDQDDWLLRERGMGLQLATNVLIGVTGAFALATLLFGIFTDWSRGRDHDDERASRLSPETFDRLLARALERRLF